MMISMYSFIDAVMHLISMRIFSMKYRDNQKYSILTDT